MSKIRQRTKNLWIAGLIGAAIMGCLFLSYAVYWQLHVQKIKRDTELQYKQQISALQAAQQEQQAKKRSVWVLKANVPAGTRIAAQHIESQEIDLNHLPVNLISSKEKVVGKISKIDLSTNTILIPSMFYEGQATPNDLRNEQFAQIQLPLNLRDQDVVDVRIQFPTGQDYIVLSKKRVKQIAANTISMQLTEQEILMMSSAMVDALIHHGSIYSLTYVDPGMQSGSIVNYPSNAEVLELIETNPNIVEVAKTALAKVARKKLEAALSEKQVLYGDVAIRSSVTPQPAVGNPQPASPGAPTIDKVEDGALTNEEQTHLFEQSPITSDDAGSGQ
ncbi:SAF domain-containing protein [Paenibacillus sp. GCM10027629]|uniref:SAF domain-containing protein n=1 Tax=Paenibacillus sp. GCM10027629 TaxID=3273414 RepID=UPI003632D9EE